ncbi:MAG: hypothetical protein ACYTBJ_22530 [Planctomycetota bacterium]|jgi:hypothetical protein
MKHALERTSPFGGPFVGTCILCGKEGVTLKGSTEQCPNPDKVPEDTALLLAIQGPTEDTEGEGE